MLPAPVLKYWLWNCITNRLEDLSVTQKCFIPVSWSGSLIFLNSHTDPCAWPELTCWSRELKIDAYQICYVASPTIIRTENEFNQENKFRNNLFHSSMTASFFFYIVFPLTALYTGGVCEWKSASVFLWTVCGFQLTFMRPSFRSRICFISCTANSSSPASKSYRYQLSESIQPAGGGTVASSTPPSHQPPCLRLSSIRLERHLIHADHSNLRRLEGWI